MAAKIKKKNNVKIPVQFVAANKAVYLYVILMLGIFPLFYRNNYINIMESKWLFFSITTLICTGIVLISVVFQSVRNFEDVKPESAKAFFKGFSITDWCVVLLTVSVLLSWLFCDEKSTAWDGSAGKMAGVYFYLIIVLAYFIVSRFLKYDQWILTIYICCNFIVFGLAILNHFMIDPLSMYVNLVEDNYWMFITTMGNINVLAGYLCVFVPVTMVLFCFCTTMHSKIIYGIFMTVSFMGLIAANGDAGILGIGCAFVFLLWFCFDNYNRLKRYFLMAALFFAGSGLIGWLDDKFADTVKEPLATLPAFISKSSINKILLLFCIILTLLFYMLEKKNVADTSLRLIRNGLYIALGVVVLVGFGTFIYLSTAGSNIPLGDWETYLRFSDLWGSSRGFTWKRVLYVYGNDYTFIQKLFGYGPDLLGLPLHNRFNDEILERMGAYLVDAHNETLQVLSTIGIFGMIGYMGTQLTALVRYTKQYREDPFLLAVAVGLVAYLVQGMMSSPQTFSTPMLIMAIAIGESIIRRKDAK